MTLKPCRKQSPNCWTGLLRLFVLLATISAVLVWPADVLAITPFPIITIQPTFTLIDPSLWPVSIPDANLKIALYEACGKPQTEPLLRGDLAALTGFLDVSEKNIADLEGIQFCVQIERLTAMLNPLTTLPDMNGMTGLKQLLLEGCQFSAIPAAVAQIPNLNLLIMDDNEITDVSGVAGSPALRYLSLIGNQITALPAALNLPQLTELHLADNALIQFPASILALPALQHLYLEDNQIADLPAGLSAMTNLRSVAASGNRIRVIPAELGAGKLESLYLMNNEITELPNELFQSTHLKTLLLDLNRLTAVPASLAGITYSYLSLEFNYIDITPGSPSRTVLDGVTATGKYFQRQLTPIKNLAAEVTDASIRLSWSASPDTVTGSYYAKVTGYAVSLSQGGVTTHLATLNKDVTSFVDAGLAPATERTYAVEVLYEVAFGVTLADSRHGTTIRAATATPTPTPTVAPTSTPAPEPSATPTPTGSPTTTETSTPTGSTASGDPATPDDRPDPPTWPFILIGGIAAGGLIVTGALLLLIRRGKH